MIVLLPIIFIFFNLCCNTIITRTIPLPELVKTQPELVEIPKAEGEPSKDPFLQLGTLFHHSEIKSFSIDEEHNLIITGSKDKTIRIWDLSTGRLINIIHPPLSNNKEGEIYAIALSPDSKIIACGGWTGDEWDHTFSIYFFDRQTGKLISLIPGLPESIQYMRYSPKGDYLAVTLGGSSGLRVFNTSTLKLVSYDKDYGKESYRIDFDSSGRLATVSLDGFIHLYDSNFNLLKKLKTVSGSKPYSISFSKDGNNVAVGYLDSEKIDIYSTKLPLFFPSFIEHIKTLSTNIQDIKEKHLYNVKYSFDGKHLLCSGDYTKNSKITIIKWETEEFKNYTEIETELLEIDDIISLKNNNLLLTYSFGAYYIRENGGEIKNINLTSIMDYKNTLETLYISNNGLGVRLKLKNNSVYQFSLINKKIVENPTDLIGYSPPSKSGVGLLVKDWKDKNSLVINGKSISISTGDVVRSIAISNDEKNVLLGGDKYLYLVNNLGEIIWKTNISDAAIKVNISENRSFAVSVLVDGSIRWYRVKDGKELLKLILFQDKKKWILFSSIGFYDSNESGDELLGWVINNDRKSAAFFLPVLVANQYYNRTDILQRIVSTQKTDIEILEQMNINPSDLKESIQSILSSFKSAEEKYNEQDYKFGTPTARVFSINSINGEILITYPFFGELLKTEQKLYVMDDDKKIHIEVLYPMHTATKCKISEEYKSQILKIKLNSVVYKE